MAGVHLESVSVNALVDAAENSVTVVTNAGKLDFGDGFDIADLGGGDAEITLDLTEITVPAILSIDGVRNDGGDVDLIAGLGITIVPDDGANTITVSAPGALNTVDVAEDGSVVVTDADVIDFGLGFDVVESTGGVASITLDFTEVTVPAPLTIDGVRNDGGDIDLIAGTGITIVPDDGANTITITNTVTSVDVAEDGTPVVTDTDTIDFGLGFDVVESTGGVASITLDFTEVTVPAPLTIDGVRNDGGDIDLIAGTGITIVPDDGANTITITNTVTDTHVDVAEDGTPVVTNADTIDFGLGFDVVESTGGVASITLDFTEVTVPAPLTIDGVRNDGGDIDLIAGAGIIITPDDGANTITIDATGAMGTVDVAEDGITVVTDADTIDFGLGFDVVESTGGVASITLDFTEVTIPAPLTIDGVRNDGGDIDLIAGTGITITPDDGANTITITNTVTDTRVDVAEDGTPVVTDTDTIDFGLGFDVIESTGGVASITLDFTEVTVPAPLTIDGVRNDGGDIDLIAGTGITITPDDGANTITIDATAAMGTVDVAEDGITVVTDADTIDFGLGFDVVESTGGVASIALDFTEVTIPAPLTIDGVRNDGGDIDLIAGTGITITPDDGANTITIVNTVVDTHVDVASGSTLVADASEINFGAGFDVTESTGGVANVELDLTEVTVPSDFITNTVTTTDGTTTTLATIAIPDDTIVVIEATISGRRTNAADRAGYRREAVVFREGGGAATLQSTVGTPFTRESVGAWNVTIDIDGGNNARVRVSGSGGHTINWKSSHRETSVG